MLIVTDQMLSAGVAALGALYKTKPLGQITRDAKAVLEAAMAANTEERDFLRTHDVARMLAVSPKTVARWAQEEKLPCVRTLGGHRRFNPRVIKELQQRLQQQGVPGSWTE